MTGVERHRGGGEGAAALADPRGRPALADHTQDEQDDECEDGVGGEPRGVSPGVLLGLAEQQRQEGAAERADLADHAAGDGGGDGPAERHHLEGGAVACAERGEAEHKHGGGDDERRRGHEAEEAGNGDEKGRRRAW